MAQGQRKKIEIFTAGYSTCHETVDLVKRIAGAAHDIEIHDMHQAHSRPRDGLMRGQLVYFESFLYSIKKEGTHASFRLKTARSTTSR
jgi:hypothetical protein